MKVTMLTESSPSSIMRNKQFRGISTRVHKAAPDITENETHETTSTLDLSIGTNESDKIHTRARHTQSTVDQSVNSIFRNCSPGIHTAGRPSSFPEYPPMASVAKIDRAEGWLRPCLIQFQMTA